MATPGCEQISVVVVDGVLGTLHRLGFPLTALVSMQEAGAQLTEASWNVPLASLSHYFGLATPPEVM